MKDAQLMGNVVRNVGKRTILCPQAGSTEVHAVTEDTDASSEAEEAYNVILADSKTLNIHMLHQKADNFSRLSHVDCSTTAQYPQYVREGERIMMGPVPYYNRM